MPKNIENKPKAVITMKTFINRWKQIKEKTASSILGIHFGHLKAYALDPTIANFEAIICYIPYTIGYSSITWRKVINTMIKKRG